MNLKLFYIPPGRYKNVWVHMFSPSIRQAIRIIIQDDNQLRAQLSKISENYLCYDIWTTEDLACRNKAQMKWFYSTDKPNPTSQVNTEEKLIANLFPKRTNQSRCRPPNRRVDYRSDLLLILAECFLIFFSCHSTFPSVRQRCFLGFM